MPKLLSCLFPFCRSPSPDPNSDSNSKTSGRTPPSDSAPPSVARDKKVIGKSGDGGESDGVGVGVVGVSASVGGGNSGVHHSYGGHSSVSYDHGGCDYGGWDGGGCFSGDSEVDMADGTRKRVSNLTKGDRVLCDLKGKTSEVICLLVMEVPSGHKPMVMFPGGLKITPRHLIFMNGEWVQPSAVERVRLAACRYVYNIMLDHESTILVNGVTCIALGHGKQGELQHEFWGDWDRVARTMREIDAEGFKQGRVHVGGTMRDATSGRVFGFTKPTRRDC
jgi:hypothetical protein